MPQNSCERRNPIPTPTEDRTIHVLRGVMFVSVNCDGWKVLKTHMASSPGMCWKENASERGHAVPQCTRGYHKKEPSSCYKGQRGSQPEWSCFLLKRRKLCEDRSI